MNLKIEYLPISEITPYARNAKQHPQEQVEQIKRSIEEFGFNDPLALWHGEIVEGHGRYLAALELGLDTLPVIKLDNLTDEQRKAYALVHNKLTMNSGFDLDLLEIELEDITDINMQDFGFSFDDDNESENERREAKYTESISIIIDCESDEEAETIYERLTEEGYKCRISTL